MQLIKSIDKLRRLIKYYREKDKSIGFVPTMGYLHEGHLSLARQAKKDTDICVMSIFVNPAQFGPKEDLAKYPRDLKRDKRLAKEAGVDIIFYPSVEQIYPKNYLTNVEVQKLTKRLCGASRPGHFKGVTTIVTKLFNIVQPDIAYFGQKDAQQAIVIQKMARDLNFAIKIKVMPIVREENGLAMSSRNSYLNPRERFDALLLYKSLQEAKKLIKLGISSPTIIKRRMRSIIKRSKIARIDYIDIVSLDTLEPVKKIKDKVLIALAVWIGKTRLIDNIIIRKKH